MDIRVDHESGDRFAITVRGHRILVDQPLADGGRDQGPTPTELFVASLGACVAFYANRAMRATPDGDGVVSVSVSFDMSSEPPARVAGIDISVTVPSDVSEARLSAVRRAVGHCTVHNSIVNAPDIDVTVSPAASPVLDASLSR